MRSQSAATAAAAAAAVASSAPNSTVIAPRPVAFNASDWLGNDGNWSTYAFSVGNNNPVNVLFSTSISEFWAVGPGGCPKNDPRCIAARGGIYNPSDSKHWSGLGTWQLGLPDLGTGGSGQYGFDTIASYSPITNTAFSMSNVLISAVTSTDYYLGYFGVGLRSGNFGNIVALPPLRQAVTSFGWIPSYSYGYTAGASYRGIVGSATLGGYDSARFAPHDTVFTINQSEGVPRPLIRGIEISAKNGSRPASWTNSTQILSDFTQAFTAIIDTTTPYLWLPPSVCDNFANALNLTYNDTFGLYTLSNEQYRQFSASDNPLTFTFSLSSRDNTDNFGFPLDVPGVVNITLPIQAFVSLLEYPFMNGTIAYGAPGVPYFTLRKAPKGSLYIGNAFLQEAYLITTYDSGSFSVHQARFPSDPVGGAQLQAIKQPPNSPYPPPLDPNASKGLSTGAMVGIAVGAAAFFFISVFAFFCFRRHRRRNQLKVELDDGKDASSMMTPETPESAISRILSRITGRKRPPRSRSKDQSATKEAHPSEAPDCQIYEMAAPVPPVELDAGGSDDHTEFGDTDFGAEHGEELTAYEIARRKLERQLQGPVPAYTPPADGTLPMEKIAGTDLHPSDRSRAADRPPTTLTTVRRRADSNSTTLPVSEPSPVSPHGDWDSIEIPSPVTSSMPPRSHSSGTRNGYSTSSRSPSLRSNLPAGSSPEAVPPIPTVFQKTPIDPSKVVCLGPLPENVKLPGPSGGVAGGHSLSGRLVASSSRVSEGSLGSNFTEEEDVAAAEESSRDAATSSKGTSQTPRLVERHLLPTQLEEQEDVDISPDSCQSSEGNRFDPGRELVHVPQLADKRYSWEYDEQK